MAEREKARESEKTAAVSQAHVFACVMDGSGSTVSVASGTRDEERRNTTQREFPETPIEATPIGITPARTLIIMKGRPYSSNARLILLGYSVREVRSEKQEQETGRKEIQNVF